MNKNECDEIVRGLAAFYDTKLHEMHLQTWHRVFSSQTPEMLKAAIDHHLAHASARGMPTPGAINEALGIVRELRAIKARTAEPPEHTEDGMVDRGEWALAMQITIEIMLWHETGIAQRQEAEIRQLPEHGDLRAWVNAGKPKTWSPIVDHYFEGLSKMNGSHERKRFIAGYLKTLQDTRAERTAA